MIHSITFNNRNTFADFGLIMVDRNTEPPSVKRTIANLPQTQGVLNFSRGFYGENFYEERPLMWEFEKPLRHHYEREQLEYDIMQWAHLYTDGLIHETVSPGLYYKDCTCINVTFHKPKGNKFGVRIEFVGYGLRQADRLEGAQTWDDFNFNTDVWQETTYRLPIIEDQLPFKELSIGDQVHIGGWAQYSADAINASDTFTTYETERSYEITDIRDMENTDFEKYVYSGIQYELENSLWVLAQDIVEARNHHTLATLYNVGIIPVIPEIKQGVYTTAISGTTMEINGEFYNFHRISAGVFTFNDKLALPVGKNEIKIYGQGMQVEFIFRKEVL